jgi:hypothetical protein
VTTLDARSINTRNVARDKDLLSLTDEAFLTNPAFAAPGR